MGYTTDFSGEFNLDSPLTDEQIAYLVRFAASRRMKRDAEIAAKFADPLREAVGLPLGEEGGFYIGTEESDSEVLVDGDLRLPTTDQIRKRFPSWDDDSIRRNLDALKSAKSVWNHCAGQRHDASVVEYNDSPTGQPGLWNHWIPNEEGTAIEWDGGEKFYEYIAWLEYIIKHFLKPWGKTLNGEVEWEGEDSSDIGKIIVEDNVVTAKEGRVVYD